MQVARPTRFERVVSTFGAIKPALRRFSMGFAPMRYATVIAKQIEISIRLAYPRIPSDLRLAAYVALTQEWEFGRENSHG